MRRLRAKPKAVIFDMDGVIVDSMPYHFIAWYEALMPWGVRVSCLDVYTREGEQWEKTLKELLQRARIKPTKKIMRTIFRKRSAIFKSHFQRFVFKGAREFLVCLKDRGYRLGLVTGTNAREISKILPHNFKVLFDCIVSGDDVKKGKPHPEPYLKAAEELAARPAECVVVENAPFGIASAKKAGMFCIALTTSLSADYLKKADVVVDSLQEITGLIEQACSLKKIK